jgi:hypothetical protein
MPWEMEGKGNQSPKGAATHPPKGDNVNNRQWSVAELPDSDSLSTRAPEGRDISAVEAQRGRIRGDSA